MHLPLQKNENTGSTSLLSLGYKGWWFCPVEYGKLDKKCFFNYNLLHDVFGAFLNFDYLINDKISSSLGNCWVWYPKSRNHKLTSMVYAHFNKTAGSLTPWEGWGNIWRLKLSPRPKHFLWLLLHNGIETFDYLYRLNICPQTFYRFCNLESESTKHLFNTCPIAQLIWPLINNAIGKQITFHDGFSNGYWLSQANSDLDMWGSVCDCCCLLVALEGKMQSNFSE